MILKGLCKKEGSTKQMLIDTQKCTKNFIKNVQSLKTSGWKTNASREDNTKTTISRNIQYHYRKKRKEPMPASKCIRSEDGAILWEEVEIKQIWEEYINKLLNDDREETQDEKMIYESGL